MTGELFINGQDAYSTWHAYLDTTGLSALMTPPPAKEYIIEESALNNGETIIDDREDSKIKLGAREIQLVICFSAKDASTFMSRYASFCTELQKGKLNINTKYQPTTLYKCWYVSCQQFTQFRQGMGKFMLRLIEPDPTDRTMPQNS